MSGLLSIPHRQRRTFKRNFLTSVHAEIRFPERDVTQLLNDEFAIKNSVSKLGFDNSKKIIRGQFQFQQQPGGTTPTVSHMSTPLGLQFNSSSARREFQIERDKFVYSDFAYQGFDEFSNSFRVLCETSSAAWSGGMPSVATQVGLRKICTINIAPVELLSDSLEIFNPALFGAARSGISSFDSFAGSEDTSVFRVGAQTCVLRSKLQKKAGTSDTLEAGLDFDLVSTQQTVVSTAFTELSALNTSHFDIFMWSITDQMIKVMEG